jgi:hypothetical protein
MSQKLILPLQDACVTFVKRNFLRLRSSVFEMAHFRQPAPLLFIGTFSAARSALFAL